MFSGLQDPARFVEFQRQLDLRIVERGEGSIHFFTERFLELVPSGIAATVPDFDEDAFPCPGNEGTVKGG